jgi:2-aminobenzoate-CoA ligase
VTLARSAHVDTFCRDNLPPQSEWPHLDRAHPDVQYAERLNAAAALLDDTVARFGADRTCLLTDGERWTYGDLLERASQVAHVLTADLGLVPGQRVLLRGPNNPWLFACWFGVLKAGGVVVATMPLLRTSELTTLTGLTRPAVLLCDRRFADDLSAAAPITPMLTFGGPDDNLNRRAAAKPGTYDNVDTAADDVAMLATTSGTTGVPKVTAHFHRDVLTIADTFSKHLVRPVPSDVFAGTPPIAFTFGLGASLVFPLRAGAASLLIEKATPVELADAVERHHATVVFTAPTAYRAILRAGAAGQLASVRCAVSAGEHLPESVWRDFRSATGVGIIDGIGSTEMLHIFIAAADDDIRPGATGLPVPGYSARVVDPDGEPVPDGTPGSLAVIGPTGCRYLADPRQRNYVRDGWNITGDTYVRDADGYFWYQGRSDDMIISAGYNIGAPEVEQALEQHPDVVECAVVGRPDPDRGMIVHAAVVLRNGAAADAAKVTELQEHTKALIAPYKYPRSIEFVAALPRTSTGKVQRFRVREPLAGR